MLERLSPLLTVTVRPETAGTGLGDGDVVTGGSKTVGLTGVCVVPWLAIETCWVFEAPFCGGGGATVVPSAFSNVGKRGVMPGVVEIGCCSAVISCCGGI